jgi:hypothetical protein
VELQTRSIKRVKVKTTAHRKNAMGRESKNEEFILEIDSEGRLAGTIFNSACFKIGRAHV